MHRKKIGNCRKCQGITKVIRYLGTIIFCAECHPPIQQSLRYFSLKQNGGLTNITIPRAILAPEP